MLKRRTSRLKIRWNTALGIVGVVLLLAYGLYVWQDRQDDAAARDYENASLANADEGSAENSDTAVLGGSFTLVDQDGKTVTEKDFGGKFMLATFGFTYCPDVCPTKLQDMSLTLDALGEDAKWVQPIFVTIDPQRDTPAQMKNYVSLYHNRIAGLTGTPEQIATVAKSFKVYYKRGEDVGDGNYMMDHSTQIYLLDQGGKVLEVFGDGAGAEAMAATIKSYLHK